VEDAVRIVTVIVVVWLVIGAIAAGQRGYYHGSSESCAKASTVAVTVIAGPLNYVGVNPKVHCSVPQPSK
jgi:membrane protein YdbS with pleckstrin-like domain